MTQNIIRVAVIGAGKRASSYFRNLPAYLKDRVHLIAFADPNRKHCKAFVDKFNYLIPPDDPPRFYNSSAELLAHEDSIDALVIGSPNYSHVVDACSAFERRVPILLEKPVAISVEECRQLWQAWQAAGEPPVTVGFVLRTTPFYERLREIVLSGQLGQVLTLDADENVSTGTTRRMREVHDGWRAWEKNSGGFMVEKCSHDFDLLRWIANSEAMRVSSFSARTHFVQNPPLTEKRFEDQPGLVVPLDYGDAVTQQLFTENNSGSLYTEKGDLPDHQSVIIEWESGITTCFTATFAQLRGTRRMRIAGTSGNVSGDAQDSQIILETAPNEKFRREEIPVAHDSSGHHGGDGNTAVQFWNSVACTTKNDRNPTTAGLREGIEAVLIGIAAQQSVRTGAAVDVRAMREQVFSC